MGGLMWIIFIFLLALLVLSLLWLLWRLRSFSQSHHQTIIDDRLLQAMLGDEALSQELKKKLVRSSAGAEPPSPEADEQPEPDRPDEVCAGQNQADSTAADQLQDEEKK